MRVVVGKGVSIVVLVLFFGALLSGFFLPVYSDEVMTKFRIARLFLEGGDAVTLYPQCATTAGPSVSWIFYPAGVVLSGLYAHLGPMGLRVSGIFLSLIWFALLAYWCLKQTCDSEGVLQRFAGLVAVASLGVLPYLWVMARPEQLLMLTILMLCLLALFPRTPRSTSAQAAMALGLALLLSIFFYSHPKSMFYMPFALTAVWLATAAYHKLVRYGLLLFGVVLCVQLFQYFNALADCQDAPSIQKMLAANTLLPSMLFSSPISFISAAYNNLISFPDRMLAHLIFSAGFQSGWLPPIDDGVKALPYINLGIYYSLYAFVIGTHIFGVWMFLLHLVRRQVCGPIVLALLVIGADVINAFFYNLQNFYAGLQFVPASIIVATLLMHSRHPAKLGNKPVLFAYSLLLVLSVVSMTTLLTLVTPAVVRNSSSTQSSLPGQPLSIPVLGVRDHLDSIRRLGQSCGIPARSAENVVVDHMTYFAFLNDKKPIHVLYVSEYGYGGDLSNGRLLPFLKGLNSPGLITRCEWVPLQFRPMQKMGEMDYCCVNFGDI
ncbi:hypothetical protein [Pseudomonas corrugata]|uniref:hypothetical protein n=1 Tax=Pseudomonas corrugata TaxID=47879 RepID=UPI001F520540|nr:hypothetical protein [Pseudomonas corrugata]